MSKIDEIVKLLNENCQPTRDRFGHEVLAGDNFKEQLRYLPEENQSDILSWLDQNLVKWARPKWSDVYQWLGQAGLFKFEPYIVENEPGYPSLVLRHNRYLHLFRGYHYQTSYTETGIGEYQSGSFRLDHLTRCGCFYSRQSRLLKILYYANCITAATRVDSFDALLQIKPELVDEFVRRSVARIFDEYDITYADLRGLFSVSDKQLIDFEGLPIYRVTGANNCDKLRFVVTSLYEMYIEIVGDVCPVVYKLTLPGWCEGIVGDDCEDCDFVKENESVLEEALVTLGLNMVGFTVNWMSVYPNKPVADLRALNRSDCVVFDSLRDLDRSDLIKTSDLF